MLLELGLSLKLCGQPLHPLVPRRSFGRVPRRRSWAFSARRKRLGLCCRGLRRLRSKSFLHLGALRQGNSVRERLWGHLGRILHAFWPHELWRQVLIWNCGRNSRTLWQLVFTGHPLADKESVNGVHQIASHR